MAEPSDLTNAPPAGEPVFHAVGVSKVYQVGDVEVHALRDVDLVATAWDHDKYPHRLDRHMRSIDGWLSSPSLRTDGWPL